MFALSLAALAAASLFAGAMLRPVIERWTRSGGANAGEVAVFLEHAWVDVRMGRGAGLLEPLRNMAAQVKEPVARERLLALWVEAALQAGRLADAASAEEVREALVGEPRAREAIRLRRVGLAVALGQPARASELARPLIEGGDTRLADEARLRLAGAMGEKELRSWISKADPREPEEARRAGLAALRLLNDASEAERLLAPLERSGQRDASLYEALADTYARLDRHGDVARVAGALLEQTESRDQESERPRFALVRAAALGRAGDTDEALACLEPLRRAREFTVRQAARRARYEVLRQAGRLQAEATSLRDPAERAFIALEVERDYGAALLGYEAASRAHPDSLELAEGLREAQRRLDLAERRALYEQVLRKEPQDGATREKLLAVLVALGETDAARRWVAEALRGRESSPEALLGVGLAAWKAGLKREGAGFLEKAYAAEADAARKQQILFALGDLYAATKLEGEARRLFTTLAADGASQEIRERAVARLATLLR